MRYSLLSRFQGTLLAAALGEELGNYSWLGSSLKQDSRQNAGPAASPLTPANLASWHPGCTAKRQSSPSAPWGKAAVACARATVQLGHWNELEMAAIGVQLAATATHDGLAQARVQGVFSAAECAIATLPLALFFYDNELMQQQVLRQTVQLWQLPPGSEGGLLAIGYAIAQALRDRLEPLTLVPQTIAYLKRSTANPTSTLLDLIEKLGQTQALIQQGEGLHTAIEQLRAKSGRGGDDAIALAFYSFLSTPDDARLSLLRAARCREAAPIVCALTGALSGSHNSLNGLPLAWRTESPLPLPWELSNVELSQLATHLFAVWSGVYHPAMLLPTLAIAAPGVIRPR